MRRTWKSFLSILLAVTMVFGAVPAVFAEDGQGIDDIVIVNNGSENQENQGTPTPETNEEEKGIQTAADGSVAIDLSAGSYTIEQAGVYTVTGYTDANTLTIKANATVTLNGVTIEAAEGHSAISILSGKVTLIVSGNNTVKGGKGGAGIYVAEGASVTIEGTGTLTAIGNGRYCG